MAYAEEQVHRAVERGDLEITPNGEVWRVAHRQHNRWTGAVMLIHHVRHRAETNTRGGYLKISLREKQKVFQSYTHRLVWYHFHGHIPEGLTINHKDGAKTNNDPANLELATYSEQLKHAREVLGLDMFNRTCKVPDSKIPEIRARWARKERLADIAADYGISRSAVSLIGLRKNRRSVTGAI